MSLAVSTVERAVDGHHHALHQQLGEDVLHAHVELVGEVLDRHALGERDDARDRRRRRRRRGIAGADGRSRRVCDRPLAGPDCCAERRTLLAERRPLAGHARSRLRPGCCVAYGLRRQRTRTAEHARRRRPRRRRDSRARRARRARASRRPAPRDAPPRLARPGARRLAESAPPAVARPSRGCVTCGRFAGASGRAGCGVWPGSSMRSRSVGGTNRPGACDGGGATACRSASAVSSNRRQRPLRARRGSSTATAEHRDRRLVDDLGHVTGSAIGCASGSRRLWHVRDRRGRLLDRPAAAARRWRPARRLRVASAVGAGGGAAARRLVRLDQARRAQHRRGRLRRLGLLRGRRPSCRPFGGRVRLGEHVAARQRDVALSRDDARRTSAPRPPRACSTRSSARSRDRA